MRILITGGQGQLGRSLQRALTAHDVVAKKYGKALGMRKRNSVCMRLARFILK